MFCMTSITSPSDSTAASAPTPLTGTPVVPGVALGPVVRVSTEVPEDAVAAFDEQEPDARRRV